jgi:hypothetical protein
MYYYHTRISKKLRINWILFSQYLSCLPKYGSKLQTTFKTIQVLNKKYPIQFIAFYTTYLENLNFPGSFLFNPAKNASCDLK